MVIWSEAMYLSCTDVDSKAARTIKRLTNFLVSRGFQAVVDEPGLSESPIAHYLFAREPLWPDKRFARLKILRNYLTLLRFILETIHSVRHCSNLLTLIRQHRFMVKRPLNLDREGNNRSLYLDRPFSFDPYSALCFWINCTTHFVAFTLMSFPVDPLPCAASCVNVSHNTAASVQVRKRYKKLLHRNFRGPLWY